MNAIGAAVRYLQVTWPCRTSAENNCVIFVAKFIDIHVNANVGVGNKCLEIL
jgi:hypothetical protein